MDKKWEHLKRWCLCYRRRCQCGGKRRFLRFVRLYICDGARWGGAITSLYPMSCSLAPDIHTSCYAPSCSISMGLCHRASREADMEFFQVKRSRLEFSSNVRRHNCQNMTAGTQPLDKCWDYCKGFISKQINLKDPQTTLLNWDLWNWIYQWQWRYNNRHNLWQIMPEVMRHIGNH